MANVHFNTNDYGVEYDLLGMYTFFRYENRLFLKLPEGDAYCFNNGSITDVTNFVQVGGYVKVEPIDDDQISIEVNL